MITRDEFEREVYKYDSSIKEKLEKIFKIYQDPKNIDITETYNLIKNTLEELFNPSKISTETMIPLSFLQSRVGSVILDCISSINNKTYTIREVAEMSKTEDKPKGLSHQYIYQELREGRLKGSRSSGVWLIPHNDAIQFLEKKKK